MIGKILSHSSRKIRISNFHLFLMISDTYILKRVNIILSHGVNKIIGKLPAFGGTSGEGGLALHSLKYI